MRAHRVAGVVILGLVLSMPAAAGQGTQATQAAKPQASQPAAPPSAESMGVSLKGVRREMRDFQPSKPTGSGLRYDFIIDVLGKRPKIDFFKDFDLSTNGPVKWGGVTHQEILNAVTPYPFRAYTGGVDLLSLGRKK